MCRTKTCNPTPFTGRSPGAHWDVCFKLRFLNQKHKWKDPSGLPEEWTCHQNTGTKNRMEKASSPPAEGLQAVAGSAAVERKFQKIVAASRSKRMAIYIRCWPRTRETKKRPRTRQIKEQQQTKRRGRSPREEPTATISTQNGHSRESSRFKHTATLYSPNPGGGKIQTLIPDGLRQ